VNVLVVCAHPDDETLGCGGTLLRHVAAGDDVTWAIATQAHAPAWTSETIERKAQEVDRVAAAYGIARYERLGFPSSCLDVTPRAELMQRIGAVVEQARPELVYVVHPGDVHGDHADVFEATLAVLKAFKMGALGVRRVLAYETLSSTDAAPPAHERAFVPTVFVDVGAFVERKLEIMALYESEAQPDPLPRGPSAIRALARLRGATVGIEYAEAFRLVRELV
jgi:LmbE family N-acetylglucosaminyl deacetylase